MADNPEMGTTEEVQDGSVESASQAILEMEDDTGEEEEGVETQRTEDSTEDGEVAETDDETESEDSEEEESETQLYTVKVDGKDVEITLDELTSGYARQSDYSKKTGELAEQRKAVMREAQAIQQERNQYAQAVSQMKSEAEAQLENYKNINWDELRAQDPMLFMQRRDEMREIEKGIEDRAKEQQHLAEQNYRYQTQQFAMNVESGREKLLAIMPDWNDKVSKEVREFGLSEGFSSDELAGITDHRSMAVLRKAMMYDAIQKAQPAKKKVKANTPKYVKPGVAKSKGDISRKKTADKFKKLQKSGSVNDGASLIYDLL